MKKTTKKTKKTAKKIAKKTVPAKTSFLSHFHIGERLALTIWSRPIENTDIFCLGMSLVHKSDMGNRRQGRETAFDRCTNGMIEFDRNTKYWTAKRTEIPKTGFWAAIGKLFKAEQQEPENLLDNVTAAGVFGKSGCWLVKGLADTQLIINHLRDQEHLYNHGLITARQLEDTYRKVFFRLPSVVI